MYSFGMSCRDIQRHLKNVYGVEVSPELISKVTESIEEDVREWISSSSLIPDTYDICAKKNKNKNTKIFLKQKLN